MGSGSYEQSWRAIPTQRPGPETITDSIWDEEPTRCMLQLHRQPPIRGLSTRSIPGPISRTPPSPRFRIDRCSDSFKGVEVIFSGNLQDRSGV